MHITIFGIPTLIESSTLWLTLIFVVWGIIYVYRSYKGGEWWEYLLGSIGAAVAIIVAAFVHEFSHAVVAQFLGIPIIGAGLSWWGAYVQSADVSITISQFGLVALAGPVASLTVGLVAAIFVRHMDEGVIAGSLGFFALNCIQLSAFNMFPYGGMDGYWVHEAVRNFFGIPDYGIWNAISTMAQFGSALFVWLFVPFWIRKQ